MLLPSKLPALLLLAALLGIGSEHHHFNFYASSAHVPQAFFVSHSHRSHTKIERCQPLMGIKGFRSWFESAFPSSVKKVQHPSPVRRPPRKQQQRGGGAGPKTTSSSTSNNINRSKSNKISQQIETQPEVYDHVLIDANQFLHSNLRKAFNRKLKRSKGNAQFDGQNLDEDFIEYSLLLLIQDLNRLTSTVAIPRKSLVIAIDGSPGAAKLEMQRRRRFGLYKKVELQQKLLEVLRERGWTDSHFGFFNNNDKKAKNKHITLLAKHEREKVTMNITPGTAYLDRVTEALLYWAWRSVANPFWPASADPNNSNKRDGRAKIYISPSMVPGEGEVKLLDFMLRGQDGKGKKTIHAGDSVAFVGGDSDLVLMGLVVPPSITQNVHVVLPGENSKTLMISIWETTRHLVGMLEGTAAYGKRPPNGNGKTKAKRKLSKKEIQQVRMDAVLLVILNGNDYLPKLRYSSTFDSFFDVYLSLMKKYLTNHDDKNDGQPLKPFLINIDNGDISINVPFAIAFFREMAASHCSVRLPKSGESLPTSSSFQQTELGILNNLVEARFLPGPLNFLTVAPEDSMYQSQLDVGLDNVFGDDVEIVRMTIGNFPEDLKTNEIESTLIGESDGHGVISRMIKSKTSDRSYLFEIPHKQGFPNKSTKLRLACLALEEIFGRENLDLLFGSQDDDDDDDDTVGRQLAPAEPVSYLGGLLWTLETYRTGKCIDYGYNYGRKSSPSALELATLLENRDGQKISRFDLIGDSDVAPLSDGMSCLAALPPQAHSILEEPYSWLVEPSSRANFEEMYNSCFSEGVFDSKSFADKCSKQILNLRSERQISKAESAKRRLTASTSSRGRHIQSSSKYWTVLSISNRPLDHPFAPPDPICDRTPRLKSNKRVRASKLPVSHALPPPVI
eukprot:scaffold354_cov81-Skeletonema_dohrnii-CCMP3373.AAC.2